MLSILTSPTSPLYLDTPIYIKVNTYLGTPPTTTIPCCHHALLSIGAPFYLLRRQAAAFAVKLKVVQQLS